MVLEEVPRDRSPKMGSGDSIGHALELECNFELLASVVASQVSKLSRVLDCDKVPIGAHALGAQVAPTLATWQGQ